MINKAGLRVKPQRARRKPIIFNINNNIVKVLNKINI